MQKIDKEHQKAFRAAIADEKANNPQYVHGRKWALIWTVMWALIASGTIILPWAINSIRAGSLFTFLIGVFFWLIVFWFAPLCALLGISRISAFPMLGITGLSFLLLLPEETRTIATALLIMLMAALTLLVLFQPSIKYQCARYEELYTQHIKENTQPLRGRSHF